MPELQLIFVDDGGEERSATVDSETFVIGRHSSCDLTIPDGRLSRDHLKIERFDGEYFASDLGSSNGSMLNGETLSGRAKLSDRDFISLGGVEITVRFDEADEQALDAEQPAAEIVEAPEPSAEPIPAAALPTSTPATASAPSSLPRSIFLIAPLLGLFVLILVGGLIYLLRNEDKPAVASNEFQYSTDDIEPKNKKKNSDSNSDDDPTPSSTVTASNSGPTPSETNTQPAQPPSGEFAKIETNGTSFLRRIATNDSRAFLTGDQAKRVSSKVKQLNGSSAVAANIESARKNSSQLRSLATAKNLKPQFLAVAAITKLGSSRGDVLQTATSMADILDKLGTHIGNELADDSLLMIAAYDQGAAGDFLKLRNQLQQLANKYPESSRQIRTIWFLKEKNQITDTEFERALNFLAIGLITQNPKEFGVNAEALLL